MSYHFDQLPAQPARPYAGPSYPLARTALPLPLADVPSETIWGIPKNVLIAVAVILIAVAVMWWLDQQNQKAVTPNRSRVKKQSTSEMAKNLYKRLDGRGGANETTLRSLQQLGRKRATT